MKKRRMDNRNGCLRCLCCACCLPAWAAGIVWFIIVAIIIVVIVLGAVAGTFVMPKVDMAGVSTSPAEGGSQISFTGETFNINFGLIISVNNPNLLSIDLTDIKATVSIQNYMVILSTYIHIIGLLPQSKWKRAYKSRRRIPSRAVCA